MKNENEASRGRHVAAENIPPIFPDGKSGFVPQQPRAQRGAGAAQYSHLGASGVSMPPVGNGRPKKKVGRVLGITLGVVIALLAIAYCGVALFFGCHFMPNSVIGNLDTSLMSSAEAKSALTSKVNDYELSIKGDGFSLTVSAKDAGIAFDADEVVEDALSQTNEWLWPVELTRAHDATASMVSSYNDAGLEQVVTQAVDAFNATAKQPVDAAVSFDEKLGKFAVSKESVGTAIDSAKVIAAADAALADLTPKVTLTNSDLLQPTVLSSDPRLQQAADKANTMIGADITLTMAKSVAAEVDATLISQWVVLDENLDATLDRDAMTSWVDELGDQCDTVGSTRTYTRVDGKVCTVSGGTYGWEIDHDGLMDLVTDGVDNGLVETVEVPYVRSCEVYNGVGGRDWGNRYIDVDLTEQHAYMYDDSGKVVWESGVVTGIPDEKKSTPEGVYVINLKKTDETLHTLQDDGVTYKDTVVKYWMPFVGNTVGLHDAWWQPDSAFEDPQAYANGYGSHGCVNLPSDKAAELYDLVQLADVVVVHR